MGTSRPDPFARKVAFLINSTKVPPRNASTAALDAPPAHPTTIAQAAPMPRSPPEVESAQIAPILAPLVTAQEPAPLASQASTTSKAHAKLPAPSVPPPSTESANAPQESSPTVSASLLAAQASLLLEEVANLATPTALNAQET